VPVNVSVLVCGGIVVVPVEPPVPLDPPLPPPQPKVERMHKAAAKQKVVWKTFFRFCNPAMNVIAKGSMARANAMCWLARGR